MLYSGNNNSKTYEQFKKEYKRIRKEKKEEEKKPLFKWDTNNNYEQLRPLRTHDLDNYMLLFLPQFNKFQLYTVPAGFNAISMLLNKNNPVHFYTPFFVDKKLFAELIKENGNIMALEYNGIIPKPIISFEIIKENGEIIPLEYNGIIPKNITSEEIIKEIEKIMPLEYNGKIKMKIISVDIIKEILNNNKIIYECKENPSYIEYNLEQNKMFVPGMIKKYQTYVMINPF